MKKEVLEIDARIVKEVEYLCSNEISKSDFDNFGIYKFSLYRSWTVDFGNGIEMDIKVCSGDFGEPLWTEAVLFDNGCEVAHTEVCDRLDGDWELEYNNEKYVVSVKK